jgi:hypothetical protein
MNRVILAIFLMNVFSQAVELSTNIQKSSQDNSKTSGMEVVKVSNNLQKRSRDNGNTVSYAYFFNGILNVNGNEFYTLGNIKKQCVKHNDSYSLSFYDYYKNEWHPIDADQRILAQGFAILTNRFEGKANQEKLPAVFLSTQNNNLTD